MPGVIASSNAAIVCVVVRAIADVGEGELDPESVADRDERAEAARMLVASS